MANWQNSVKFSIVQKKIALGHVPPEEETVNGGGGGGGGGGEVGLELAEHLNSRPYK